MTVSIFDRGDYIFLCKKCGKRSVIIDVELGYNQEAFEYAKKYSVCSNCNSLDLLEKMTIILDNMDNSNE